MSLVSGDHIIQHSRTEKLLGANICEDLKWKEQLLNNEQSVVRQLTSRINGLVKVCGLGWLWGYLLNSLQILQNRAARAVTRKFWFTPTRVLLADCGWLSVRQLVSYLSILSAHKMVTSGKPHYMHIALSTIHHSEQDRLLGDKLELERTSML